MYKEVSKKHELVTCIRDGIWLHSEFYINLKGVLNATNIYITDDKGSSVVIDQELVLKTVNAILRHVSLYNNN